MERAPALPSGLRWLGAPSPPLLGDGRVVVLLWWSATSVHCERALAVVDWLGLRFADRPLVVASVHVPRDPRERGAAFVQRACARFGVRHAVAVDDDAVTLADWSVRALPTVAVVDAHGTLRYRGGGEPDRERLGHALDVLLGAAQAPPPPTPEAAWPAARPDSPVVLRAPSGVAVDGDAGLLWIADTGRHRVLAAVLDDGTLRHVIGDGRPGATDGDFGYAAFCAPRGLSAAAGICHVADAGNHQLRRIDTSSYRVDTLLGQGRLVPDVAGGLAGAAQGIAAPWDVEVVGDDLYVAMAGTHQVWQVTLGDGYGYAWSGVGHPGRSDGMRHDASYAQPAALAFACDELAIADADNGAVRIAGLSTQHVHSVAGPDAATTLAQPRGIAWHRGDLLVAETLANRIVRVRTRDGRVEEVVPADAGLCGPEGLAVSGDRLFVADTGNDRVVEVDLTTGAFAAFVLVDPHPDHPEPPPPPLVLRARAPVALCFPMPVPTDERLHPDAIGHARVRTRAGLPLVRPFAGPVEPENAWGTIRGLETADPGDGELEVVVRYATSSDRDTEPHVQELTGRFAVRIEIDGPEVVDLPIA